MSEGPGDVDRAKADVAIARERFAATLGEIKHRISPRTVAHETWSGLRDRGARAADDAVELARARPAAAVGVVAAVSLFILRRPLIRAATKLFFERRETESAADKLKAADIPRASPRPRRRRPAGDKGD